MASTFSPLLNIELIGIGDQNNTWGSTTNVNLGTLIEDSIAGTATVNVTSGNVTLSVFEGSADQARCAVIRVTGTPGVVRNVIAPAHSKLYVVSNGSNADVVIKTAGSTGLTVNQGQVFLVYYDTVVNDFVYISRTASVGTVARTLVLRDTNGDIGSRFIFADGFIGDIAGNLVSPTATAFTQPAVTNNTTIATTAFVKTAVTTATGSLGTMSTQNANAVAITGGSINGANITGTRIVGISPNGGTSGAITLADAVGNPNAVYLQAVNNASTVEYSNMYFNSNGTISVNGPFAASSFSGAGTGLTGTANTLNAGIGVNQSWVNKSGSRSFYTTFINNTGRAIMISVTHEASDAGMEIYVNSIRIGYTGQTGGSGNDYNNMTAIVPAGAPYSVNPLRFVGGLLWVELTT